MKDADLKNQGHFKYNQYKSLLPTLLKRSKESYFTNYFQTNINYLKNTSIYIKKLTSLKRTSNSVPSDVIENIITLSKSKDIANAFNNYFTDTSSSIQFTLKCPKNKFNDFLSDIDINSFFIKPVDKIEIQNIIFFFQPSKSCWP